MDLLLRRSRRFLGHDHDIGDSAEMLSADERLPSALPTPCRLDQGAIHNSLLDQIEIVAAAGVSALACFLVQVRRYASSLVNQHPPS